MPRCIVASRRGADLADLKAREETLRAELIGRSVSEAEGVLFRATILRRVFRLKPATLRGAIAKVRFLASVDEDSFENYLWNTSPLRQILGDLQRLARKAVSS